MMTEQSEPTANTQEDNIVIVDAEPVLPVMMRTKIRQQYVMPYLPPPIVRGWKRIDPVLEPYFGPEPTISVMGSLLLSILVWQVVRVLSNLSTSGRAIVDDDDDDVILSDQRDNNVATIVLCGPPNAGKTRLFYYLCFGERNVSTVTSLRANIDVSPSSTTTTGSSIRFVDYPGHASMSSSQFLTIVDTHARGIILVVDTTQPVSAVANILYQLLSHKHGQTTTRNGTQQRSNDVMDIFVACHKCDVPNAKNWRRIKIQLRTELERLLKVRSMEEEQQTTTTTTASGRQQQQQNDDTSSRQLWWTPGRPLDMDNLPYATLQFCSTSCESGVGMQELMDFVTSTGGDDDDDDAEQHPDKMAKVELI